jgi:hypothetical protein
MGLRGPTVDNAAIPLITLVPICNKEAASTGFNELCQLPVVGDEALAFPIQSTFTAHIIVARAFLRHITNPIEIS